MSTNKKRASSSPILSHEDYQKYIHLYNSMNQGVVFQNAKGEITAANPAAEKFLGLSIDQMQGRKSIDERWKSIHLDGSDFPGDEHPAMVSLKTGKPVFNQIMGIYHPLKDDYVWILVSAEPIFEAEEDKPYEVFTTFTDITSQIIAEKRLKRQSELQAILTEVSSSFIDTSGQSQEMVINKSLEMIGKFLNADRTYIFDYDHEEEVTNNTFEWCNEGIEPQIELLQKTPFSLVSLWIETHFSGGTMNIPDIFELDEDDTLRQILEPQDIKSLITVPIFENKKCVGFVGVDSVIDHRIYGDIDENILKIYAQLLSNLNTQVKNRQEIEENRRFLEDIFQSSDSIIIIKDTRGVYQMVNQKWVEITGIKNEDVIGKTDFDLFPYAIAKTFSDNDQEAIQNDKVLEVEELLRVHNLSEPRYFLANKFPVKNHEGVIIGVCGIVNEISERKRIESELIDTNNRLLNLVNSQTNYVLRTNLEGNLNYANLKYIQDFGWLHGEEDIIGSNGLKSIMPYHHERTLEAVIFCINNPGQIRKVELDKPIKNGSIQTTLWEFVCIVNVNKEPYEIQCMGFDITKEKQASEKLKQSEEKYKTLFNDSPDGYLILKDNVFIECNNAALEMFRSDKSALIGRNPLDISPEYQPTGERSTTIATKIEKEIEADGKSSFEWVIQRLDGTTFLSNITATPIQYDGNDVMFITWRDITKQNEAIERNKLLSEVIEQSPMYVKITDPNGAIEYVNSSLLEKINSTLDDQIGKISTIWSYDSSENEILQEMRHTLKQGSKWRGEFFNNLIPGNHYWENIVISPIRDRMGVVKYYVEVSEDISTKKEAEKERIARKEAEAANVAKNRFLSNMSHEIRTPLQAIMGYSHILKRNGNLNDKQLEQVSSILRSGNHLLQLIEDILQFSVIESKKLIIKKKTFRFSDVLNDMYLMFSQKIEEKGTYLILPEHIFDHYIYADESKIRQVLVNIIGNAVKFTAHGGIKIEVLSERDNQSNSIQITVSVSDTGPGMTAEEINLIFEEFRQFELGFKEGGTGLGMSISYHLTKALGGNLSVSSVLGEGTVVTFDFPAEIVDQPSQSELKSYSDSGEIETNQYEISGLARKKLLIVDDNQDNRETLRDLLEPLGYEIFEAIDGQDGVDKALDIVPNIILMDIRMPRMNGYDASRVIKSSTIGTKTKIIAVTASEFDQDEAKVLESGLDGYIRKPFQPNSLFELIKLHVT
jgi:PAS domain S-box-containing protein